MSWALVYFLQFLVNSLRVLFIVCISISQDSRTHPTSLYLVSAVNGPCTHDDVEATMSEQ